MKYLDVCFSSKDLQFPLHHASPDVGELPPYLLDKGGKVADSVFVDAHSGDAGQVGKFDVRVVVVAVQDEGS